MPFTITCPYCFQTMQDDEVHFRSEKVNQGDCDALPDGYSDIDDFIAHYNGKDKNDILVELKNWDFFTERDDAVYEGFWKAYNGTTESNPADKLLKVEARRRRVLNPTDKAHQTYLKEQSDGTYFIKDAQGMVAQIELKATIGIKCNRRVCCHCHNPLPDNYGRNTVRFATVVGITGAGKTIYLSQILKNMESYCAKVGLSAVVTNPGVLTFLEENGVIAQKPLPGSTSVEKLQQPLFYNMERRNETGAKVTDTFVLYDVAGEVFKTPGAAVVEKFAPFVKHADGVVVLVDPMQFRAISGIADDGEAKEAPTTVLRTIHNLMPAKDADERCAIPFAICMSKADTKEVQKVFNDQTCRLLAKDVEGIKKPDGFCATVFNAQTYNPLGKELYYFMQANEEAFALLMNTSYAKHAYFACTALGCDVGKTFNTTGELDYTYPIGPILSKHIEEPLLWLFHQLGYIGENEMVFDPAKIIIPCPVCQSEDTIELDGDDRRVCISRFLWMKKYVEVQYKCNGCGHMWNES